MKAVVITQAGGPDVLELRDVPLPAPGERQIRVRVQATAINRADLLQRRGQYAAPAGAPPDIPGLEYAGTVDELGSGVSRWQRGDRVMGIVGGGGYAEYLTVHEAEALPVPDLLSLEDAAAVPEAFITADDALFTLMHLQRGETVLIHAVASGVGTAALQLARATAARVVGTSRSAHKLARVAALGLDFGIDTSKEKFVEAVMGFTDQRGVAGVLDLLGGHFFARNVECLTERGRAILVGLTAGASTEVDLRLILRKRLTIIGTVLRARPLDEKIATTAAFAERSLPWLRSGIVQPVIDRVLPIEEVQEAHRVMEDNENVGKIVLTWK